MADAASDKVYILDACWFKRPDGPYRYQQYLDAANPIARKYGAHRVETLIPKEVLMGDSKPDFIYVVEWPSMERYEAFRKDPGYRETSLLKQDACTRHLILACKRP